VIEIDPAQKAHQQGRKIAALIKNMPNIEEQQAAASERVGTIMAQMIDSGASTEELIRTMATFLNIYQLPVMPSSPGYMRFHVRCNGAIVETFIGYQEERPEIFRRVFDLDNKFERMASYPIPNNLQL